MPIGNFNDEQELLSFLNAGRQIMFAGGPVHDDVDTILEMCAWIIQWKPDHNDAAATEMVDTQKQPNDLIDFVDANGKRQWRLILEQKGNAPIQTGIPAVAQAIGKCTLKGTGKERVVWWGNTVDVVDASPSTDATVRGKLGIPTPE